MRGIRFISAIEAEMETKFSEAMIKNLTGGDKITARFLFKEFFEFFPTIKIFLAANHKPEIRGTDHAIWRRIRLIPFNMKFEGEIEDKNLKEKLQGELPGILNWSLQGCVEWQKHGLGIPSEVRDATEEYRNEMDIIGGFLSDCCVISPTAKVLYSKFYDEYTNWSLREGDSPLSKIDFGKRLIERGFQKRRGTGNKTYWQGVGSRTRGEKVRALF